MPQAVGLLGRIADRLICREVHRRFRRVYWIPPDVPIVPPCILVPNHHGWHDGHMMYLVVKSLGLQTVGWVQDPDSLPLASHFGGMPFPVDDTQRRAATIRKTIRLLNDEKRCLLLFAEGNLHSPPEILPFGKALEFVASLVPKVTVMPVAIRYDYSMHERPECYLAIGKPMDQGPRLSPRTRLEVKALLDELAVKMKFNREAFRLLVGGHPESNER